MARPAGVGAVGAVAAGTGAALAVAVPAALLAQVVDAVADDDPSAALTYPLVAVVLAGAAVGGWVSGRRATAQPVALGAVAGVIALAVVQAIGVARRIAGDDDVAWSTVPVVLVVGALLAAGAAGLAARRAGRTRP